MPRITVWSANTLRWLVTIGALGLTPVFSLHAQIQTRRDYSYFPGCYDLAIQMEHRAFTKGVRVAFDTIPQASRTVSRFLLRFPDAAFGARSLGRTEWSLGKNDSVLVTITGIDSERSFRFGRFGADTVWGWSQEFMFGVHSPPSVAIAVKQLRCG